jgi:hypothetical protein
MAGNGGNISNGNGSFVSSGGNVYGVIGTDSATVDILSGTISFL